jgi:hypothetical protein
LPGQLVLGEQRHQAEDWHFQHAAPDQWFDVVFDCH